jgi:hypothetical protein
MPTALKCKCPEAGARRRLNCDLQHTFFRDVITSVAVGTLDCDIALKKGASVYVNRIEVLRHEEKCGAGGGGGGGGGGDESARELRTKQTESSCHCLSSPPITPHLTV